LRLQALFKAVNHLDNPHQQGQQQQNEHREGAGEAEEEEDDQMLR
jgi:hypothetical protein